MSTSPTSETKSVKKRKRETADVTSDGCEDTVRLRNQGGKAKAADAVKTSIKDDEDISNEALGLRGEKKKRNRTHERKGRVVERVNALPLETFVSRYIPQEVLNIRMPISISSLSTPTMQPEPDSDARSERVPKAKEQRSEVDDQSAAYSLSIYDSSTIPRSYSEACFSLIERTSSSAYRGSSSGWSPRKKKEEMKLPDMRYLLLLRDHFGREQDEQQPTTQDRNNGECQPRRRGLRSKLSASISSDDCDHGLGGFASFMVTYEDSLPVLYCYELHLHPTLQHRGLGKLLMQTLDDTARNIGGLQKTMLSVFRSNVGGKRFYERLGYVEDEFSPKPMELRGGGVREWDYLILSKGI